MMLTSLMTHIYIVCVYKTLTISNWLNLYICHMSMTLIPLTTFTYPVCLRLTTSISLVYIYDIDFTYPVCLWSTTSISLTSLHSTTSLSDSDNKTTSHLWLHYIQLPYNPPTGIIGYQTDFNQQLCDQPYHITSLQ